MNVEYQFTQSRLTDGSLGILGGRKKNRAKASTPSIVPMRYICPDDISSLAEQILEILPLTLEGELSKEEIAICVRCAELFYIYSHPDKALRTL